MKIRVASPCNIDSIVDEVREEVKVPIAAVHCEGFKSRIWATGFDIADHRDYILYCNCHGKRGKRKWEKIMCTVFSSFFFAWYDFNGYCHWH